LKRHRFPSYVYNKTSIVGAFIAGVFSIVLLVTLAFQAGQGETNPYLGIVVYMALPPIVLLGFILIPIGMFFRWRYIKKHGEAEVPRWPAVDLNKKSHRNAFFVFVFGTVLLLMVVVFGGYWAFMYTESVPFCGTTCHTVMKPEYTAYQDSPHSRVRCTACHVGEGAGWYARSKLSGMYQVYATIFDVYPRPIPTPIKNLRPAPETCEKCHWPEKFFGAQQKQFSHYMYDEGNTHWPTSLLIKTGGGNPESGRTAGIHWHMNIGVRVDYIARDERRQDIPWVRVEELATGRVTIYQDEDKPLTEEEGATLEKRRMDCMDCHNRPSHKYHTPDYMIDHAILTRMIDRNLPSIKRIAVEAMAARKYESEAEADSAIAAYILTTYEEEYPEVYEQRRDAIERAIAATRTQFSLSMFPEMNVRWEEYPDNIGHFSFPGCMRCHAGNKVSEDGLVVSHECTACHTILSQGSGDRAQMAVTEDGLEFVHPEDIDEEWRETGCFECHTGTQP